MKRLAGTGTEQVGPQCMDMTGKTTTVSVNNHMVQEEAGDPPVNKFRKMDQDVSSVIEQLYNAQNATFNITINYNK